MGLSKNGILFDYEWCTGCHSCEISCQIEHGFPVGQTGVMVFEVGPYKISGENFRENWQYSYQIALTKQCNGCAQRIAFGKEPTCVKHCQAKCLTYGSLDELHPKLAEKKNQALFVLGK